MYKKQEECLIIIELCKVQMNWYYQNNGNLQTNEAAQRKICSLKKGAIPIIFDSLFECQSQNEIFNNIEQVKYSSIR